MVLAGVVHLRLAQRLANKRNRKIAEMGLETAESISIEPPAAPSECASHAGASRARAAYEAVPDLNPCTPWWLLFSALKRAFAIDSVRAVKSSTLEINCPKHLSSNACGPPRGCRVR